MFHVKHEPSVVHLTDEFIVLYKPPKMHCVPVKYGTSDTLLGWCARQFPEILSVHGKKEIEGGILHRLDYETHGLVLAARTQDAMDGLLKQQIDGSLIKTYEAVCKASETPPQGFPAKLQPDLDMSPMLIQSGFRPFGVGRKAVRPVLVENGLATNAKQKEVALDKAVPYQTEIISVEPISTFTQEDVWHFQLRIKRGFRHQIRCHLAWLGFPIVGDILYGGSTAEYLALTAQGLSFLNPADGKPLQFSI